jgi:hypothetical protein
MIGGGLGLLSDGSIPTAKHETKDLYLFSFNINYISVIHKVNFLLKHNEIGRYYNIISGLEMRVKFNIAFSFS